MSKRVVWVAWLAAKTGSKLTSHIFLYCNILLPAQLRSDVAQSVVCSVPCRQSPWQHAFVRSPSIYPLLRFPLSFTVCVPSLSLSLSLSCIVFDCFAFSPLPHSSNFEKKVKVDPFFRGAAPYVRRYKLYRHIVIEYRAESIDNTNVKQGERGSREQAKRKCAGAKSPRGSCTYTRAPAEQRVTLVRSFVCSQTSY